MSMVARNRCTSSYRPEISRHCASVSRGGVSAHPTSSSSAVSCFQSKSMVMERDGANSCEDSEVGEREGGARAEEQEGDGDDPLEGLAGADEPPVCRDQHGDHHDLQD